jgi:hypothetical protein
VHGRYPIIAGSCLGARRFLSTDLQSAFRKRFPKSPSVDLPIDLTSLHALLTNPQRRSGSGSSSRNSQSRCRVPVTVTLRTDWGTTYTLATAPLVRHARTCPRHVQARNRERKIAWTPNQPLSQNRTLEMNPTAWGRLKSPPIATTARRLLAR